jgi:hypothetical protein
LAAVFLLATGALGYWQLYKTNERLLLLQEQSIGGDWTLPRRISHRPEPSPAPIPAQPPKTTDFLDVDPEAETTRALYTAMVAAFDGADLTVYTMPAFNDVQRDEWYAAAVAWAKDKGIISGIGNNLFAPENTISREQMAVMLTNYMKFKGREIPAGEAPETGDYDAVSGWAFDSVNAIRCMGIIPDKTGNRFDPQGKVTNAEIDAIFERLTERLSEGE